MLEKTDTKQGARFRKGQSGNPSGRPRGARNKTTRAVEALLDGEAEALTRKAIERALEGDTTALCLCLDRLLPPVAHWRGRISASVKPLAVGVLDNDFFIYKCAISEWAFVIEIVAFLGIPKPIPAVRTIASADTYCAV